MKNIEKEYNKRFSNQQLPNGDFDADGLWDAISDDLDGATPKSPIAWWRTKWVLGLALLLIIGAVFTCYKINTTNTVSSIGTDKQASIVTSKTNHSNRIESNNTSPNLTNSATKKQSFIPAKNKSTKNSQPPTARINNEIHNARNNARTDARLIQNSVNASSAKNDPQGQVHLIERLENSGSEILNENENLKDTNIASSNSKSSEREKPENIMNASTPKTMKAPSPKNDVAIGLTLNSLPSLSTLLILDETGQYFPIIDKPYNEIDMKEAKALAWQFSLLGGVNNFMFNYSSSESTSITDLRDQTDTSQWGNNFGFKTAIVLKSTWILSSGLEYQNLYARFDFTGITNTQVLKENEILKILIDSKTGETLNSVIGDTLVDATTTRTIVHHNRYQQFTLPLEFGFQKNRNGFIYGVQAGASFNFVTDQSGKTINPEGDIVSFDSDSAYTPFRSFHIGFRLSPLVGYQISNHWALTFRPQWAWNPQIGFDDPSLRLRTQQFNLILGVRYSL